MASHYNHPMEIIIPAVLPPSNIAPELIRYIEAACPSLIRRFKSQQAHLIQSHPDETGCTPYEAIELKRKGFVPDTAENLSSGLGPLRAGVQRADEKVWIAELCSVAIGTHGPSMIHPDALGITQPESDALFEAVATLWMGSAISALPLNAQRWRIWLPESADMLSASPYAIAGMALADWWPQHESLRSWRKLLNEIQMVWYAHPVNQNRTEQGQPPINSLWLYGGAKGWNISTSHEVIVFEDLLHFYFKSDWANWIAALPALESFITDQPEDMPLTLLGDQRGVQLNKVKQPWWRAALPAKQYDWKRWWNLKS